MPFSIRRSQYSTRLARASRYSRLTARIHPFEMTERLDEYQLMKIHEVFIKSHDKLKLDDLKSALYQIASVTFDNEEFNVFFKMINKTGLGYTTWDEFISFLLVLYEQKNINLEHKSLVQPISKVSKLIKSNHRHPVCRITFSPTVQQDRKINMENGNIVTCSKDGVINFWSLYMQLERTVQSTCPALKVHSTWITDLVVLPDLNVICTSGTERDLRFYDTSARKFQLRVWFSSLKYAVSAMYYKFSANVNQESTLIVGDMAGNVMVIYIVAIQRGPFKSSPGDPLLSCRFERVLKGLAPGFRVVVYKNCHTDFVRQISYYDPLHGFLSCANCSKAAMRMNFFSSKELSEKHVYMVNAGIWCFATEESAHIIATGGGDCLIRIWNPFVPSQPISVFYGHHKEIIQLTFQDKGKMLYSLDKSRWIKAWDVAEQHCVQTFNEIPSCVGEHSSLTTYYNDSLRSWIVGSSMIAMIPLSPIQSEKLTDGNTHPNKISVILYNPLFKLIVTCCTNSYILVWNPWDGRRMLLVKNAHTKYEFGEVVPLEITAGAVDPSCLRILTAAVNGTVKIWNILTGTNLRNIQIPAGNAIKSVVWVPKRIFVCGWNKYIAEFPDSTTKTLPDNATNSKDWEILHDDDISASVVRIPETLVTASYGGELVFWRLETGQAYKKFSVYNPTENIKIQFQRRKKQRQFEDTEALKALLKKRKDKEKTFNKLSLSSQFFSERITIGESNQFIRKREIFNFQPVAVTCMVFLQTRISDPDVGSLLVALSSGLVQVWSHASAGGFLKAFDVAHKIGDYALCMATDKNNEYLMVGTSNGYIKIYLMKDFGIPNPEKVCMPKYRLKFPFLWGDRFRRGAMIQAAKQPKPTLLSSIKGHNLAVTCIQYIDNAEIIISGSADCSARLWTISGRYLQTLGTFKKWKPIQCSPIGNNFEFTIPADLKRTLSSTTLRVLSGGVTPKKLTYRQMEISSKKRKLYIDKSKIYGDSISEPFLGNYFKELKGETKRHPIEFDLSFPHIPVYNHLIIPEIFPIADVTEYMFNKIDKELDIDDNVK